MRRTKMKTSHFLIAKHLNEVHHFNMIYILVKVKIEYFSSNRIKSIMVSMVTLVVGFK